MVEVQESPKRQQGEAGIYVDTSEASPTKKQKVDDTNTDTNGHVEMDVDLTLDENKENENPGKNDKTGSNKPKTKLTKEEREQMKKAKEEEKAAKEREREEKRRAKEEEKAAKEREREQKQREKEEKQREKEEEKAAKERAREQKKKEKEEEQALKEQKKKEQESARAKAQTRIGAFFTVKKKSSNDNMKTEDEKSDFDKHFYPFHVKPDVTMSQGAKYEQDNKELSMDDWLSLHKKQRGFSPPQTASQVYDKMNLGDMTTEELDSFLDTIPLKFIRFAEHVRPPYIGTWSKPRCTFGNAPFTKMDNVNYDYDSEQEWDLEDDEGMGEDLDDEDENSEEEDVGDEMQDFLDQEEDDDSSQLNRLVSKSKAPVVKWNGVEGPEVFTKFQAQFCIAVNGPIDPFYDYWGDVTKAAVVKGGGGDGKKLKMTSDQLSKLISTIDGLNVPKNVAVHQVHEMLNGGVSKAEIEKVIALCMEKREKKDQSATSPKKGPKVWQVNDDKHNEVMTMLS